MAIERPNRLRRSEASDEQCGANEQHHGQRALQHQEGGAEARASNVD